MLALKANEIFTGGDVFIIFLLFRCRLYFWAGEVHCGMLILFAETLMSRALQTLHSEGSFPVGMHCYEIPGIAPSSSLAMQGGVILG